LFARRPGSKRCLGSVKQPTALARPATERLRWCVKVVRKKTCEWGAGDVSPWDESRPPEAFLYLGVMAFLVLAVGMAVAGSSGQGCLG